MDKIESICGQNWTNVQIVRGHILDKVRLLVLLLSSLCPTIKYHEVEIIIEQIGCLDKKRTNLGLVSQYCPPFVQLQGEIEIV